MADSIERISPGLTARDSRFDFLRGVALLVVLVDHIEDQTSLKVVRPWMPVSTCFFDGAEAFVFLSGLIFGRTFQRYLEQKGFFACQLKAIRRSFTIYLAYLTTVMIVIGIGLLFGSQSRLLINRLHLDKGAGLCALWALPMCYQPWGFPILAVYSFILPFMPFLLAWMLRSPLTAWIIPTTIYIVTLLDSNVCLPQFPWGREWTFNPFAWQFLFFLGMSSGVVRSCWQLDRLARIVLILACLAIFAFGVLIQTDWLGWIPESGDLRSNIDYFVRQWSHKNRFGPIRLLHFASFVIILSAILPRANSLVWRNFCLVPIIRCGQNSLGVYSLGVIMTFLSIPVFSFFGESLSSHLIVEFDCCVLSIGFAFFLHWISRTKRIRDQSINAAAKYSPPLGE